MSYRKKINSRLDLLKNQRTKFLKHRDWVLSFASLTNSKSSQQVYNALDVGGPQTAEEIAVRLEVPAFTIRPYLLGLRARQSVDVTDGGEKSDNAQTGQKWYRVENEGPDDTHARVELDAQRKAILTELQTLREAYPKELEILREQFAEDDLQYHDERKRLVQELSLIRDCTVCSEEFISTGPSVKYCSETCASKGNELKHAV